MQARVAVWASCVFGLSLAVGCKREATPTPIEGVATPAPAAPPSAKAPLQPADVMQRSPTELGLSWEDPAGWKRFKPKSSARAANYEIPLAAGDEGSAELTVFYFGQGRGGTVESNIQRWVAQFSDVKDADVLKSDSEANGMKQHIVEIKSGSFAADMMMMRKPGAGEAPRLENQALLGAVVEAPTGLHFFKLTGPKKSVAAAREPFMKMLASMKPAGGK